MQESPLTEAGEKLLKCKTIVTIWPSKTLAICVG